MPAVPIEPLRSRLIHTHAYLPCLLALPAYLLAALACIIRLLCLLAVQLGSLLAVMRLLVVSNYLLYLIVVPGWCTSVPACFLPCRSACVLVYCVSGCCLNSATEVLARCTCLLWYLLTTVPAVNACCTSCRSGLSYSFAVLACSTCLQLLPVMPACSTCLWCTCRHCRCSYYCSSADLLLHARTVSHCFCWLCCVCCLFLQLLMLLAA